MQVTPRKRPVQRRSAATVDFILAAAARILEEEGLARFNTNALAARAGISIGSLYQYFPNKEAITAALIVADHHRIVRDLHEILSRTQGTSIEFTVCVMIDVMVRGQAAKGRHGRLLELEEERLPRTGELLALEEEIEALNRQLLGRYVDPVRCPPARLGTASRETVCIVRALLESASQSGVLDDPDLRERLCRVVEAYLAPLVHAVPAPIAA